MTRHMFHGRISKTIEIGASGESWHVAHDARISVQGGSGIEMADGVDNSTIVVDGRIETDDHGLYLKGSGNVVRIGKTAVLSSMDGLVDHGVLSVGDNLHLTNHGQILGFAFGIYNDGFDQQIVNTGVIEATIWGVTLHGFGATLLNASGAVIQSSSVGVKLESTDGDRETVTNHGLIKAGPQGMSIYGAGGTDIVYSDGRLVGDVNLDWGSDILDLRGGTLKGRYFGGNGNDVLITDDARHRFVETPDAGQDIVGSSVTYRLPDNVETLILIGRRDVDGFGNAGANSIKGNGGANRLEGGAGEDLLKSGKGDDVLVGGTESDTFYFARDHGDDEITDFQPGVDMILLDDWIAHTDFDDIMIHARDLHGDTVIRFESSSLTLVDVDTSDLSPADFGVRA